MNALYEDELPNGIRLVHKQVVHTQVAHCGFVMDTGSRDEQPEQAGLAHFWEHMAFKGTKRRKAFHILSRMDRVGGELNAYTTKEKIQFYSSSMAEHFERAVDILADITFNSTFPDREIQKERSVILEEMAMYEDDPADAIADEFDGQLFGQHPLGRNILGERRTVQRFSKADFDQFLADHLDTRRMVFASVGPLPFGRVRRLADKYLSAIPEIHAQPARQPFVAYQPSHRQAHKPISQAHCIIGTTAPGLFHPDRVPFSLLINLLGGPALNSRLNMLLREKHGYVYGIEAHYQGYSEVGSAVIQFATERKHLERCVQLALRELRQLRDKPLGSGQLLDAKKQLMGQLAIAEESNLGTMLLLGKSLLDFGKTETLEELFAQIHRITAPQLQDLAQQYLSEERLSRLVYWPEA